MEFWVGMISLVGGRGGLLAHKITIYTTILYLWNHNLSLFALASPYLCAVTDMPTTCSNYCPQRRSHHPAGSANNVTKPKTSGSTWPTVLSCAVAATLTAPVVTTMLWSTTVAPSTHWLSNLALLHPMGRVSKIGWWTVNNRWWLLASRCNYCFWRICR